MQLFDFEKNITDVILSRGWDYYKYGYVKTINQDKKLYTAIVEGTNDYSVTVELDEDGSILHSECNCPYDMGPYCKHEVAVFYALKDMHEKPKVHHTEETNSPTRDSKHDKLIKVLSSQSKEKLVQFVTSLTFEWDEIFLKVEQEFGGLDSTEVIEKCKGIIRDCINKNSDRYGYINYSNAYAATEGASKVIDNAKRAIDDKDYILALDLYLCILHEMVPAMENSDDSSGSIGGVIEETITDLMELSNYELLEDKTVYFFDTLLAESNNKIYHGWPDLRLELLKVCSNLAVTNELWKQLESHFDSLIHNDNSSSLSSTYLLESISLLRYRKILEFDGEKKANEFIERNINFPQFREMAIKGAMSRKDYSFAEKLSLDGELQNKSMPGLVRKWQEFRYEIYRLSGQLEMQRRIAMGLTLDGKFDYYKKLKSTYPIDEWLSVYPEILMQMSSKGKHYGIYTDILIEEKEFKMLLQYVENNPSTILKFHKHLLPLFRNEVYEVFLNFIMDSSQKASNRNSYRDVCSYIELLAKEGGTEPAREVISRLRTLYPRKPAFQDELRRIMV